MTPRSSIVNVAGATIFVAAAGYAVLVIAARALSPERYLEFSVFWAALYLAVGAIFGIQQETTRAVKTQRSEASSLVALRGTRAISSGLVIGMIVGVCFAASSLLWANAVFGQLAPFYVVLITGGIVLYSGHAATAGALAGAADWRHYSRLLVVESGIRLLFVGVVAVVALSVPGLAGAVVAAMATWLAFLSARRIRAAAASRLDAPLGSSARRSLQAVVASFASAIIVTGNPLILAVIASAEDQALLARIILVVTLTRAPIMLPLNAFLGMIISRFVDQRTHGVGTVLRPMLYVFLSSLGLGFVAILIGRPLLTFVFGAEYDINAYFIGGATIAAGFVGVITVSGAATLARGFHLAYTVGWFLAAATTCVILMVPLPIEERVLLSLLTGPILGALLHVSALTRRPRLVADRG